MIIPGLLHDDTVVIISTTHGLPDLDGLPSETTVETPWEGVNVQQIAEEETDDETQDSDTVTYRVAGAIAPVEVKASDRIRWRGQVFLIKGEPDTRRGALRIEHTSLLMYRTRG
jgi:head-tail adaptor